MIAPDESKVRQQDARIVLMYISMGSYEANRETWNFVKENWQYFYSTLVDLNKLSNFRTRNWKIFHIFSAFNSILLCPVNVY